MVVKCYVVNALRPFSQFYEDLGLVHSCSRSLKWFYKAGCTKWNLISKTTLRLPEERGDLFRGVCDILIKSGSYQQISLKI